MDLKKISFIDLRKKNPLTKGWQRVEYMAFLLLGFVFSGCVNEDFINQNTTGGGEGVNIVELPGYLGISITPNGKKGHTRADNSTTTSDGKSFNDGLSEEYRLVENADDYHFLLFFEKGKNTQPIATSFIIGNNFDVKVSPDPTSQGAAYNNLTLTIKKLVGSSLFSTDLTEEAQVLEWLKNKEAYVLLNFDRSLIDNTSAGITIKETNFETLQGISKDVLLKLPMKDYKITLDENNRVTNGTGTEYFTMSNSVYLDNVSKQKTIDSKIDARNKIFALPDEALTEGKQAIEVHVERLAVKYTVDLSALNSSTQTIADILGAESDRAVADNVLFTYNPQTTVRLFNPTVDNGLTIDAESYTIHYDDVPWHINVLGYGLNAVEETTYLFKNLTDRAEYFEKFNDPDNNRSYWTEDLHYSVTSKTGYPEQYRNAIETQEGTTVESMHDNSNKNNAYQNITDSNGNSNWGLNLESNKETFLQYFPFNDFKGKNPNNFYSLENTYSDTNGAVLGEKGYYSAGTHFIMACQLFLDNVNTDDFYMDQNSIIYTSEAQILNAKYDILHRVVLDVANHGYRVLETDWKEHSPMENYYNKLEWEAKSLIWMSKNGTEKPIDDKDLVLIPAELSGGDGERLIAPSDPNATYYLAPLAEDGVTRDILNTKPISYNEIISLIHKVTGPIEHFKNGYMYYAAPITHKDENLNDNSYNTPGAIGTVRNNWYELEVNAINGVGRSVDDPEQPIIPTLEVKRSYLNMSVNMLDWHYIYQYITNEDNLYNH